MAGQEFEWFVGIDWASAEHEVRLLDARGTDRGRRSVPHTGPALGELGDWLEDVSGRHPERVAVAIELVRGAIVEALLARGFAVFGINPKQLDRFRDRYTVAGAKDDRLDAFVLADTLRTDRARYRALQLDDPKIIGLRGVVEAHEELTQELRRLCNRLRAQLERFYPQVLRLCPAADEPWLWALLVLAPTPAHAARLRGARVDRLLRGYRIRRLERTEVMTALREKALPVAPGTVEASSAQVALLLARLRLAHAQHAHCEQQIDAALEDLAGDDGESDAALRSLPGVGRVVAARLLVDATPLLAARDYGALRSQAGIAPVTRQSGKRRVVTMRRACSGRLRQAMYHWAFASVQRDPRSREIYAAARTRGQTHGRALRGLADRLLRVLVAMLNSRTPYDPDRIRRAA